jgi:hypothetical protein
LTRERERKRERERDSKRESEREREKKNEAAPPPTTFQQSAKFIASNLKFALY